MVSLLIALIRGIFYLIATMMRLSVRLIVLPVNSLSRRH